MKVEVKVTSFSALAWLKLAPYSNLLYPFWPFSFLLNSLSGIFNFCNFFVSISGPTLIFSLISLLVLLLMLLIDPVDISEVKLESPSNYILFFTLFPGSFSKVISFNLYAISLASIPFIFPIHMKISLASLNLFLLIKNLGLSGINESILIPIRLKQTLGIYKYCHLSLKYAK